VSERVPNPDNPRRIVEAFERRGIKLSIGTDGTLEAQPAGLLTVADCVRLSEMKANVLQFLKGNIRRF
jgi:hypothetical protein